jgi:hypothetical protein
MNPWQFSLRRLFIWMTLVGASLAFAANYPDIAAVCLLFALIIFAGRVFSYLLVRAPLVIRVAMVGMGSLYLAGGVYAFVRVRRAHDLAEGGFWTAVTFIVGLGLGCYWAAWAIPSKKSPNGTPTETRTTNADGYNR